MADFWRDLVLTAMHNMSVTLGTVLPSILAMLTLVVLGALLGWIAGTIVSRLALALGLDRRSRTWGITSALARAGIYRPPSQVLRLVAFWGIFVIFATMGIDALAIAGAIASPSGKIRSRICSVEDQRTTTASANPWKSAPPVTSVAPKRRAVA